MSQIAIRPAGPEHAAVLAQLHEMIFAAPGEEVWDQTAMREILGMPGSFALLAVAEEDPVGLAIGRAALDEVELLTFGIVPRARRAGAGARLLRAFFHAAAAHGAIRLFLEVRADNEAAIALYRSLGLPVAGRRRGYYRSPGAPPMDALVMTGDLPILTLK